MVDIQRARQELKKYVNNYDIEDKRIKLKVAHIERTAIIAKEIAENLKLDTEDVQLAELIGLLHDIGRFEQYRIFDQDTENQVLDNIKKFDHGIAGVEVLKKDNYIRKYIEENSYDDIIYTAVYEHNKYELTRGLSKEEELFSKIVKDADKLDLLYEANYIYWQDVKRIEAVEKGKLSKKMLDDFYKHRLTDNRNRVSEIDQILRFASFIFDMNFKYSFQFVKENDYVSKMIDRFEYQVPETKVEMMKVKQIANKYVLSRV